VPVPGRDIMVQAWYQGGISIFEFTDPTRPREIAFFDRGPLDAQRPMLGGHWSAYYYNGLIVASEIARGMDIFELVPSAFLSADEIAAAKLVRFDQFNAQMQPRFVWPASFVVARAFLDQLTRANTLRGERIAAIRQALAGAEGASGSDRWTRLDALAGEVDQDVAGSGDTARVRRLAQAIRDLAAAAR
jgi:hypothetical protein